MIKRTHLAIGLAVALLFLPYVNKRLIFFPVVLICSLLPDIDSPDSAYGQNALLRPLQFLVRHRGMIHSFTFCVIVSIIFALFIPVLALPFFLGYGSHLFADSFTIDGITPFWPLKSSSTGFIRTGGKAENTVFIVFLFINVILFLKLFA